MTTPIGSKVAIVFPTQVTVPSGSTSVTGCSFSATGSSYTALAGVTTSSTSPITLAISDAFTSAAVTGTFYI